MPTLYLIRGLPGSGKTTLAERIVKAEGAIHCEADHFFYHAGVYEFLPEKVREAHTHCFRETIRAMNAGYSIVVSNTFTREKELKPYLDWAEQFGYTVVSLVVENRHGNTSVHDVPEETMEKMRNRFSIKL